MTRCNQCRAGQDIDSPAVCRLSNLINMWVCKYLDDCGGQYSRPAGSKVSIVTSLPVVPPLELVLGCIAWSFCRITSAVDSACEFSVMVSQPGGFRAVSPSPQRCLRGVGDRLCCFIPGIGGFCSRVVVRPNFDFRGSSNSLSIPRCPSQADPVKILTQTMRAKTTFSNGLGLDSLGPRIRETARCGYA